MRILKPIIVCLFCVLSIFILSYIFPSMINDGKNKLCLSLNCFSEKYASDIYNLHVTHPAFAGRVLTSSAEQLIHRVTGLGYGKSFAILNFTLLLFCGLMIYKLAIRHGLTIREAFLSAILFYGSFTILLAFFHSIDTYDEPIQYFALFASLFFLRKKSWISFGVFIFLSLLAREGSAIALPAFFILLFYDDIRHIKTKAIFNNENLKKFSALVVPTVLFIIVFSQILSYRQAFGHSIEYAASHRLTYWQYNFKNWQFGIESMLSLLMVLGWPVYLLYRGAVRQMDKDKKEYVAAFIVTAVINTAITLASTRAREARIFALPLIFIWPVLGGCCWELIRSVRWRNFFVFFQKRLMPNIFHLTLLFIFLCFLYVAGFYWYKPTDARGSDILFQLYFFITFSAIAIHSFMRRVQPGRLTLE